jgi:hypothetical protein
MAAQPEPLQRFFGAYKPTASDMGRTLEDAAQEIERLLPKLFEQHTTGSQIKAAQLALILREVRAQQHAMWADLGITMRDGMEKSALAAVQGENIIDRYLARNGMDMPDLRASFRAQAMRGFKNVLAKGFNGISLSRQVYKTEALANGWIDKVIRRGLILQTSAKDLAKQVHDFIDPNVKGGVSFAAFRLARTELNNAFHTVAVDRADEPWAKGVGWHLSGSHPPGPPGKPEVCERYARVDHGLGTGIWLPGQVPKKPHPQCLCYITQEVVGEDEFIDKLLAGDYDEHLGYRAKQNPPAKDPALAYLDAHAHDPANTNKQVLSDLVNKYGVRTDDAKAMLAVYRPPKKGRKPTNRPTPTVVPLDPEQRPVSPPKGTPGQGQRTGPIKPATSVPTSTPATPAAPSQAGLLVQAHIQRITNFTGKKQERVRSALDHQARFTPKTMLKLVEVKEMDREAPSYGQAGVVGEYDERSRKMFLHPSAFLPRAQQVFEHEKKTNYISKCGQQFDSLDNLIAHEYGHHVHDRWIISAPAKVRKRIIGQLCASLGIDPPLHHDNESLLRWGTKHQVAIANRVGRYGSTNILEMMAEVWAEYTLGDPPRGHIREMGDVLRDAAEEYS